MPRRLTLRATVVLVSLLFSVCFTLQLLGRSSSPRAAMRATQSPLVERPGAAPKLSLVAAKRVPALRDPRKPKPKPKPTRHKVVAAPKPPPVQATPTATASPIPTPAATAAPTPRYVPPARTPAPTPKATPAPSGSFDTSGTE
jgi:hypothetical protein